MRTFYFMAISGESATQFTTIAKFILELSKEISAVFTQVPLTCDAQGLIGRQMATRLGQFWDGKAIMAI